MSARLVNLTAPSAVPRQRRSNVAADAVLEARLYAESIVDAVRDPLVVIDSNLRVHSVNRAFSTLFGVASEELVGAVLSKADGGFWDTPELLTVLKDLFERKLPVEDLELGYDSASLGPRILSVTARTMRRGGAPELVLVAISDMTERRQVQTLLDENEARRDQERLLHRKVEVSQASRVSTVGELAAGLAHELNQPLSSISNILEACGRYARAGKLDPDKLLELLSEAASETVRAAGIVAHLRSFVDKGEPQLELINLAEIIAHVPQLMLRELERAGIALRIHLPPGQLSVEADRIQIEQVFVNLIQNAVDSIGETDRAERTIELSACSVDGKAEVSVRDTGSGVSEEAAGRLFEAFFTTKAQGLGMGLALCRSILEAHHGCISLATPADGEPGAVVRFSIPLYASKRNREDRAA